MEIEPSPGTRGAVAVIPRRGRLLVIRRSRHVVAPRAYCFPGGAIEGNESEEEALVRELREELNAPIVPQRRIWQCVTSWQVQLFWWLARLEPGARPVPNPAEVESVEWHTAEEMAQLPELLPSNHDFLAEVAGGRIDLSL